MSKYIAVITRADITRAALVEAGGRSMEQVKAACGCQYIINSWFYDTTTGKAVGNLKINGSVKASAGWNGWGLTWDKGADIRLDIVPDNGGASYLSGVELLTPTRGPGKALSYSPEYGGTRGRSAVLLAGARVRVERGRPGVPPLPPYRPPWHLSEMRRSGAAPAGDGYLCCWDRWPVRSGATKKSPALTGQAFLTVRVGERLLVCADCVGAGEGGDRPRGHRRRGPGSGGGGAPH